MKKSAFSLIELSIVLVIIGVLIIGAIQGAGMIKSARLNSARSFTSKSPVPEISGLIAWYEVSSKDSMKPSEVIDGGQVSEWRDISPGSIAAQKNKLTKSADATLTYKSDGINKAPSMNFNGAGKISLANFYQGASAQGAVFLVFRPNFAPSGTAAVLFDSNSSSNSIGVKSTALSVNAGSAVDASATFVNGGNYIVAVNFNNTASATCVNNTACSTISIGSNQITGLVVGTDRNTTNGFNGFISEVIVYNRPLKLQERKDVMKYLSKKYGIAVTGL